jgi:citrate synthase
MAEKVRQLTDSSGQTIEFREGLEGVIAAASDICFIDGVKGILQYRGIPIDQLADKSTFEETSYFLLFGHLPTRSQLTDFENRLKAQRGVAPELLRVLADFPRNAEPMTLLRTAVSALGAYDANAENMSVEQNVNRAIDLIASFPTILAAIQRIRKGMQPIAPHNGLGHTANFLYMLTGETPNEYSAKVLDVCLILHADHGFNASTFTARVCISSLSDMYSAITAALGSLKGPLHGGANSAVMHTLMEIGSPEKVETYVKQKLAAKQKIMGFGHRVYHTYDPRARILNRYSHKLAEITGNMKWYEMSKKMEEVMEKEVGHRGIYPNVDFYSASVYYYLGIDIDLFTPIFAVSRISGWAAQVLEQLRGNKLFRPECFYQGPLNVDYLPIDKR